MLRAVLRANHIEFGCNRVVQKTTQLSPFEVVYGFNRLTPMDLPPFPNSRELIHKEGTSRANFLRKLHEKVKIQQQSERYTQQNNKGKREIIVEEGD